MAAPARVLDRPSILFVDDEPRVLNSMRAMFRREYETYFAASGHEALTLLGHNHVDVIVADHRMPQMTGVEVLTRAKKLSPNSVRILLTGYADQEAVEQSINDGEVFRFLTKPCPPNKLRETVELAARLALDTANAAPLGDDTDDIPVGDEIVERTLADDEFLAALRARREADRNPGARAAQPPKRTPPAPPRLQATPSADNTQPTIPRLEPAPAHEQLPASKAPLGGKAGIGILVFSSDETIQEAAISATRGRIPVYRASNIVQVVKILNEHAPGVLLTDISEDKETIQSMTARLKEHLPELVTIAVSEHRDVLDMVWLINHGQIFRFLRKPLSPGRCAVSFKAALLHHRKLLRHPELLKRHVVETAPDDAATAGKLSRLNFLKKIWGST